MYPIPVIPARSSSIKEFLPTYQKYPTRISSLVNNITMGVCSKCDRWCEVKKDDICKRC